MRLCNVDKETLEGYQVYYRETEADLPIGKLLQELLDRREEAASEHRNLERGLAYTHACTLIDGCCGPIFHAGADWSNTADVSAFAVDSVAEAVTYLDSRGLLLHAEDAPNLVQINDESEATDAT